MTERKNLRRILKGILEYHAFALDSLTYIDGELAKSSNPKYKEICDKAIELEKLLLEILASLYNFI